MPPARSSIRRAPLPRFFQFAAWITCAVFVAEATYIYATKFLGSIHSDACVTALLAWRMLASHSLVLRDFYWANGDVWVLGPHLFALLPVAVWGLGPSALFAAVLLGFVAEMLVLTWAYRQLSGDLRVALFATAVSLIAWSRIHILFVYVELSYGFLTAVYLSMFVGAAKWLTRRCEPHEGSSRSLAAFVTLLLFLVTLQNPPRALVFGLVPLLAAFAWPFYGKIAQGPRLRAGLAVVVGWASAFAIYQLVFRRVLTFSLPSGHNAFVVKDFAGIVENITILARGIAGLAGAQTAADIFVIPGLMMIVGAMVLVVREVVRERALSTIRVVAIATSVQFLLVLGPMIVGNLVVTPPSARYLMPSIFQFLGLGVVIAAREVTRTHARATTGGWILLVPAVAVLSALRLVGTYTLEAKNGQWAHASAHVTLANELIRRGLTHGFSAYWNSNLVTLLSHGKAQTCGVQFADGLIPYKWVTDVGCYDRKNLPERIYVVAATFERKDADRATRATLGIPVERFDVDGEFDVSVFRRDDVPLDWLLLPLPEGDDLRFPMQVPATHPMVKLGKAVRERDGVIATAQEGAITFGPYLTLPKGHFRVRWIGTGIPSSGEIAFDIGANSGKDNLGAKSVPAASLVGTMHGPLVELDFDLSSTTPGVEFRSYSRGGGMVKLEELVLERL